MANKLYHFRIASRIFLRQQVNLVAKLNSYILLFSNSDLPLTFNIKF